MESPEYNAVSVGYPVFLFERHRQLSGYPDFHNPLQALLSAGR